MDIIEVKKGFVECAIGYGEALRKGNSKIANNFYSKLCIIKEQIEKQNGVSILLELISYKDINVQYCSAVFLLPYKEKIAMKILKKIEKTNDIIGVSASIALDSRRK